MPQSTGANLQVGIDTETTFGTTPGAPAGKLLHLVSSTVAGKRGQINNDVMRSTKQPFKPTVGNLDVSGTLSTYVDSRDFGLLLNHMLGAPTTTGAGPYNHIFKAGNTKPTSMLIEHNYTDQASGNFKHLFNGCKLNNMNLALPQEGFATVSFDVIGATQTNAATSFDGTLTEYVFNPFSGFDAAILEGGASIATVSNVNLAVAANLDGGSYTIDGSGGARTAIPEGMYAVTGSFDALFDSMALLDKATAQTTTSLQIALSKSASEAVTIDIPELRYEVKGPEVSGPAGIMVNLAFTAFYDTNADTTALKITLDNDVASY